MPTETDIITRYFKRATQQSEVRYAIGDDAALVTVPAGQQLAITVDTLNENIHFPADTPPFDIGYKAVAVNLSDLAAMGAEPKWITLSLSLPQIDEFWLAEFSRGLFTLLDELHVDLIGGDLNKGPLSITIQAEGFVPSGQALMRSGAQAGDLIYVSGVLGSAAVGLYIERIKSDLSSIEEPSETGSRGSSVQGVKWKQKTHAFSRRTPKAWSIWPALQALHDCIAQQGIHSVFRNATATTLPLIEKALTALRRPQPQITLGLALRGIATSAVDLSDGLARDLAQICRASGVGACIERARLPLDSQLVELIGFDTLSELALTGGDDYQLCFTVPPAKAQQITQLAQRLGIQLTQIGHVNTNLSVIMLESENKLEPLLESGFEHFK